MRYVISVSDENRHKEVAFYIEEWVLKDVSSYKELLMHQLMQAIKAYDEIREEPGSDRIR